MAAIHSRSCWLGLGTSGLNLGCDIIYYTHRMQSALLLFHFSTSIEISLVDQLAVPPQNEIEYYIHLNIHYPRQSFDEFLLCSYGCFRLPSDS